ncbi:type II secretion system protein [Oxalobacteraceae bacterium]|nr:type II secretion system protein [Oxalobacteraceae bacterium]
MARSRKSVNPRRPGVRRAGRQRGAALLLLVAVMGVGGAALFLSAFSRSGLEARRQQRTLVALARAEEALIGYAVQHGRLPRPAVSAADGSEAPQPCADEKACSGFLPSVTLGVEGADAWGKLLRYSVTPEFTREPIRSGAALATKTLQSRDANGKLFYRVGAETCDIRAQCAPAVVFSSGRENFGTTVQGLPQANGAEGNEDEQNNEVAAKRFVQRALNDEPEQPGGVFDDLVRAMDISLLYRRMNAAGKLK